MMTLRRARWMLIVGIAGLATMGAAYHLTYEPAPAVRVEWRRNIPGWRRALLEQWYRLGDPQAPHGNSYAYELFDTRADNIRALVADRYVVGTGDIDRAHFAVPWESLQESDRFMWGADRIPIVRFPLVRDAIAVAFAVAVALGARRLSYERK